MTCGAGALYQIAGSVDCSECKPWALQAGIALMVKQFRTGQKGSDSCPGARLTADCVLDTRCTPPGLTYKRGWCTSVDGHGMECLDMCDPASDFKGKGAQAGTMQLVEQVRAGRDPQGYTQCPSASVWRWIWFPLLLCCCVGICALTYAGYRYYMTRLKKFNNKEKMSGRYADEDMLGGAPPMDYSQVAPQPPSEEFMNKDLPPAAMPALDPLPVGEPGITTLATAATPGQALLNVNSQAGFEIGQMIQINEGPMQEVNEITGFGSLVLKHPLQNNHPAGTPIKALPAGTSQAGGSIFGAPPSLLSNALPTTMAAPQTVITPMQGSTYTSYPMGGSMYGVGVPQTTSYVSTGAAAPVTTAYGGSMATAMPSYGAYGAYTTQYPTTSMRIT